MSNLIAYVVLVAAFVTVASYASVQDDSHKVELELPSWFES